MAGLRTTMSFFFFKQMQSISQYGCTIIYLTLDRCFIDLHLFMIRMNVENISYNIFVLICEHFCRTDS